MPQASEHRLGRAREPSGGVAAQPKGVPKPPGRAVSQERHAAALTPAANGLSPAPKLRLLPPRPAPLEERGKKLELERGRAAKRGSACRRGPLKADHGVRVPGSPQAGAGPGGAPSSSFSLPAGAERRRGNLARSKSVSIGDLSGEDVAAALSRLALRDGGHQLGTGALALKRSSSLRRVNVSPGPDGKPAAPLLSVRHEGCPRTRVPDPPYAHGPDGPVPGSPPLGRAPAPGRPEEKAAAVRAAGRRPPRFGDADAPRAAAGLRPRRPQESGQHVLHERGAAVPEQHQAAARLLPAQGLPAGAARRAPRPPGAHRGLRRRHRGAVAPRVHRGRQPRALQGRLSEIRPLLHRLQPAGRAGVPQVLHGPAARRDQPQGPQDAQHPRGHAPRPRARGRRHAERRRARQPDVEAVPGEGGQQDRGPLRGAAEELPQVPGVRLPLHHLRGLLRPLPAHPQEELRGREGFAPRLLQPLHQGGGAGLGERARVRQVPAADAQHQEAHHPALPPRPGAAPQPLLHHALLHQEVLRLRRLPPAAAQPARVRQREGGQPRLQPVRALQPLGQRALRPLHRLLPRPLGLAALQRLPRVAHQREPGAVQRGLRPLLRAPRPPRQEALSRPRRPPRPPPLPPRSRCRSRIHPPGPGGAAGGRLYIAPAAPRGAFVNKFIKKRPKRSSLGGGGGGAAPAGGGGAAERGGGARSEGRGYGHRGRGYGHRGGAYFTCLIGRGRGLLREGRGTEHKGGANQGAGSLRGAGPP